MLEYTNVDDNTNILISSASTNVLQKLPTVMEGLEIATPTGGQAMYTELIDISNNAQKYAQLFATQASNPNYQFNPNDAVVYNPDHPDYIPKVREVALMDTHDYMNYQSVMIGVSSVALLSVIVGTMFFSSNRV